MTVSSSSAGAPVAQWIEQRFLKSSQTGLNDSDPASGEPQFVPPCSTAGDVVALGGQDTSSTQRSVSQFHVPAEFDSRGDLHQPLQSLQEPLVHSLS